MVLERLFRLSRALCETWLDPETPFPFTVTESSLRGAGAVSGRSTGDARDESLGNPPGSEGTDGILKVGGMGGTGGTPFGGALPSIPART